MSIEQTEQIINDEYTVVGKFKFKIPTWGMRKQLAYQNLFLPLISGPIISGLAYKNEDEEKMFAAIISGLLDALAESDLVRITEVCLEGVAYKIEGKPLRVATIEALEEDGVTIADMYMVVASIIKKNLGSLLKKDLLNSLMTTIGTSAAESLSF